MSANKWTVASILLLQTWMILAVHVDVNDGSEVQAMSAPPHDDDDYEPEPQLTEALPQNYDADERYAALPTARDAENLRPSDTMRTIDAIAEQGASQQGRGRWRSSSMIETSKGEMQASGNPDLPLVLYYTDKDDPSEKLSREALARKLFGTRSQVIETNSCLLSKFYKKCMRTKRYNGVVVIMTHAGSTDHTRAASILHMSGHMKQSDFYTKVIGKLQDNPIPPDNILILACNTGTIGGKFDNAFIDQFADRAKSHPSGGSPLIYGPQGFVLRGMGPMQIVTRYDDHSGRGNGQVLANIDMDNCDKRVGCWDGLWEAVTTPRGAFTRAS